MKEPRALTRDIEVTLIPYGDRMTLTEGANVYITQALGGTFTAMTERGYMVRIEGLDADAIGEELPAPPSPQDQAGKTTEQLVWEQLNTCYDPEIPVSIVELGLVYTCELSQKPEGGQRVEVRFTLTSPACPLSGVLIEEIRRKLLSVPGVVEADVQVVFEPPWSSAMMSDAARLQLGLM
jgi:probable FeS assembly SUF system protein SufT